MSGRTPNGACIAWWYLTTGVAAHTFIAAFLHRERSELMVEIAEGSSIMAGFPRDSHIVKPSWYFDPGTQRDTLSRVLKYCVASVQHRIERGFDCTHSSFCEETGLPHDNEMLHWEAKHNYRTEGRTPRPAWWPTRENISSFTPIGVLERREALHKEGWDLQTLISVAKQRRKKRGKNGSKVIRRVGRFTVFWK